MGTLKTWLIGLGAVIASVVTIFVAGRKSGKDAVKNEQLEGELDELQKANKVAMDTNASDSDAVKQRMLDRNLQE